MRHSLWLGAVLVGALAAEAPIALEVARAGTRVDRADTLPIEEIHRGMKGYGLTVFEGTRPERFGVEVIDVVKKFLPAQDLILIKTTHPRLDVVNTVQGMSGSPIFIDGKMVGAYSYGWSFGKEPVAGVTPIRNMLDDFDRPLPKEIFGWPIDLLPASRNRPKPVLQSLGVGHGANRYVGVPGEYRLEAHAAQLALNNPTRALANNMPRALTTPVMLGGLGSMAADMASRLFEPLGLKPMQGGGGGGKIEPDAPQHFEDGGAIGVELVRGDIDMTPIGTVTRVEGDRLVAFGHPMMNAGVTALPTAIARILWILASEESSMKFGASVRPLGALVNDRQASIVVTESAKAPVIPVALNVEGVPDSPRREWHFEVAQERFMTPSFLAIALGNALQATAAERQDVTWTATSKVKIRDYGEITVEDFGVSVGGTPDPSEFERSEVVSAVGAILNNPWKAAFVDAVTTNVKLNYARELVRLRGAQVLESEIDAGQPAHIALTLIPYAGPPIIRTITVPMPRYLAGTTVKLLIRPGHSVEREKATPESLEDFIRNIEQPIYPPKSVVVSYSAGAGVAFKGQVATQLPPGAMDSIVQQSSSYAPEAFGSEHRQVIDLPEFMVGTETVSVKVRPALR
jgi:SpoIVB peptidase S55